MKIKKLLKQMDKSELYPYLNHYIEIFSDGSGSVMCDVDAPNVSNFSDEAEMNDKLNEIYQKLNPNKSTNWEL